ncbi:DUF262 domain-containing protein [Streptococcus orisratti]
MPKQQILEKLQEKFAGYQIEIDYRLNGNSSQTIVVDFAIFQSKQLLVVLEVKKHDAEVDFKRLDSITPYCQVPVYLVTFKEGEVSFQRSLVGGTLDFIEFQESLQENVIEKAENDFLGVENTEDISSEEISNPFNPDEIKIQQQLLSVRYLYELYTEDAINLSPDFQRGYVWKENKRKSHLIESLMLSIPIPAFYLFETGADSSDDYEFSVIDGQQRLTTIFSFLDNEFRLSSLEYLGDLYNGKKFSELPSKIKSRINRTQLALNTLSYDSPHRIVYDIFKRINTGGKALNHQEMRNAVSSNTTRSLMNLCAESDAFLNATNRRVKVLRLDHHELVLRFFAFYRIYNFETKQINYQNSNIVDLLNDENDRLNKELIHVGTTGYLELFKTSMAKCYQLFGDKAFVKINYNKKLEGYEFSSLINKPLFSAFSVLLANPEYADINFSQYRNKAIKKLAQKLEDPVNFMSISTSTNSKSKVENYFKICQEVIEECLSGM